uniref:Reverse transcriptase zinc-binding domain-containing protein n=1 Tax=Aegilops tauschii subsp. strangulata TaxID=200361 RepID=A0A453IKQ6_AEGTS
MQFMGLMRSPLMQVVWRAWAPRKCRLRDRLMARGWPNSYFCPLCWRSLDTARHLVADCPWSRGL